MSLISYAVSRCHFSTYIVISVNLHFIFILILTKNFFFFFSLQILSYLTNLLFLKSHCYIIIFHIRNRIKYLSMLCSSHRSLMDSTQHYHSLVYAGSQFSLHTRTYTHAHRLFVYVFKHTDARG